MDHARTDEELTLKAEPAAQLVLVDLQALDSRFARLTHQVRSLPAHAELETLEARLRELDTERVRAETAVSDLEKDQRKADADVEQVKARRVRDQQRLDSGAVTNPKDLTNLQHEVATLDRRISALEDQELEVMESLETAQVELARIQGEIGEHEKQAEQVRADRDRAVAEAEAEATEVRAEREQTAARVPDDLLVLYEKLRTQHGTGAAVLHQRRCEGCRLELNAADIREIAAAAADDVLRCPECQRILVRTSESGI